MIKFHAFLINMDIQDIVVMGSDMKLVLSSTDRQIASLVEIADIQNIYNFFRCCDHLNKSAL
jgi:hypothetical protein